MPQTQGVSQGSQRILKQSDTHIPGNGYPVVTYRVGNRIFSHLGTFFYMPYTINSKTTQNQLVFAICYAYLYSIGGTTSGQGVFPYVYDVISGGATAYLVVRLYPTTLQVPC